MTRFPTIDELNAEIRLLAARTAAARVTRIGVSRLGEPLSMLSVGTGDTHALVIGGPHPNEPVGFLTVLELARRVAATAEPAGWTWHLVPCGDPDAARLNEGWYTAELTIRSYHRHFYRPALAEQPEWTFPVMGDRLSHDRIFPETRALMRVIDTLRPRLLCSLHNRDLGGAFFVLSRPAPELAEALSAIPTRHDVPLAVRPAECVGWPNAAPGVWINPAANGASSGHYAARRGALSIMPEVPMWRPGETGWPGPLDTVVDQVGSAIELLEESLRRVDDQLVVPTPFRAAVLDNIKFGHRFVAILRAAEDPAGSYDDTASAAVRMPLRAGAMLLRMLDAECAAGNHRPVVRAERAALAQRLDEWCAGLEAAARPTPIPVGELVAIQVEAALAAAAYCVA